MNTTDVLIAKFSLNGVQAEIVIQATKLIIESDCWKSDAELEDIIAALAWNLSDYEYQAYLERRKKEAA